MRHEKNGIWSAVKVAVFIVCLIASAAQTQAAVKQQSISDLPLEGQYAVSAAIGHDRLNYQVRLDGGGIAVDNTEQGLAVKFLPKGIDLGGGEQQFSLRPMQWGYGEELIQLPEGIPQAIGNMVTSQRGSVNEWYVNGPLGLQQGFTVTGKPQIGTGPLKIAMALEGAKAGNVDADGRGVMLTKLNGSPLYRYSGLVVRDADGREAQAWIEAQSNILHICVDDIGMRYPLYIDPVIQSAKLIAADGGAADSFGCSVAISGDTVVVGAEDDDIKTNSSSGSAYVFVKPSGGWADMTHSAILTASDGRAGDNFGYSVAISGDTIVVGAYPAKVGTNVYQGAAYVFVKPAGGWATRTQSAKLTAADGAADDCFGYSVAISGDTIVVGAYKDAIGTNTNQGSAYVFKKPAGGWATMTQSAKLTASDGAASDYFGNSVAVSGDTVVVGAYKDTIGTNTNQGSAYVFEKPAGGWATMTESAKLTASDGAASDYFGNSVAVSGDTVVVGAYKDTIGTNTNQGSAYVFEKPSGGWATMTESAKLTASDSATYDYFGYSVGVSGDTVAVGAYGDNTYQGSAYVFVKPAEGWADMTQSDKLTASDGAKQDFFGYSIAISDTSMVVGAVYDDIGTVTNQGSAYVFTVTSNTSSTSSTTTTTTPIIASNLENDTITRASYLLFTGTEKMAVGFTTDNHCYLVQSIVMRLRGANWAGGGATRTPVKIYSAVSNGSSIYPGNFVGTLSDISVKDEAEYTSVSSENIILSPNTTYWIVLETGTYEDLYCYQGGPTISGPGSILTPSLKGNYAATTWEQQSGFTAAVSVHGTPLLDADNDGVADTVDNCPNVYNPRQLDADGDGIGDVCDTTPNCGGCGQAACEVVDRDGDGIADAVDNCPNVYNPQQLDANGNGTGDCCDPTPGCGGCGQVACDAVCAP